MNMLSEPKNVPARKEWFLLEQAVCIRAVEHLPRHDHAWAVSANNGSVGKVLACATAKKLPVTIWTNRHRLLEHSLLTRSRRLQRSIRATKNPFVPTIDTAHSYF
jgi:hypothetical protein